jgi:mono/diheme cytochrome c family protein
VFGVPAEDRKRRAEEVLAQAKSPTAPESPANPAGAAIYAAACATCHESKRPLPYGGVNLALSTALSSPDARNAANIVLSGVRPVEGERSPIMPGFAASMSDAQIAALLNYLRVRFGKQPAWAGVEQTVADARRTQTVFLQTPVGANNAPADASQRDKP